MSASSVRADGTEFPLGVGMESPCPLTVPHSSPSDIYTDLPSSVKSSPHSLTGLWASYSKVLGLETRFAVLDRLSARISGVRRDLFMPRFT